ncbi:MAG: S-layer homology domain-containing protein [Peptococcaceae bacterium]|jgi:hypothetical protein|nr:S-layer homology domain-containing protein [Peptococcaceae bacterium]
MERKILALLLTAAMTLALLPLNGTTGEISGTPTTAGTANLTIKAANSVLPDATKALSITINTASSGAGGSGGSAGTPSTPPTTTPAPGGSTTVTTPAGKPPVQNPDGSAILPGGGTVTVGSSTANIALPGGTAISVPTGSTIRPDGTVSIGTGGATVRITIRTSATVNNSGAVAQNQDGSVGIGDVSVPLGAEPGTSPIMTLKLAANTLIVLDEAAPLGYSVEFNNPYSDVKSSDWFYGDVAFVGAHGLMTGTAADKFSPNAHATLQRYRLTFSQ